jgi:small-conductance mechanosensitive channel
MKIAKTKKKIWRLLTAIVLTTLVIVSYSWLTASVAQGNFTSDRQESLNIYLKKPDSTRDFALIAQTPTETKPEIKTPQIEAEEFPVVLDGKTLFTIKVGGRTTTAEQRAELATEEIERIAKDYSIPVDSFKLQDFEEVILITAQDEEQDKVIIVGITNDDAQATNQPLDELASQYFQTIKDAIVEYRKERTSESLVEDILFSVVLTVALVILIVLLFKLESITRNRIEAWRTRAPALRIQRLELLPVETQIKIALRLIGFIRLIIMLTFLYGYFSFIFRIFPQTRQFGAKFRQPFYEALNWIGSGFVNFLPNLFIIILTIIVTYYLIRFCGLFFKAIDREIISLPGFDSDWAKPTNKIVAILIVAGALAVIFPYLPMYNSPAFQGISVLIGALITFGGASTVANLVGGTVIIYTRAYRLGDLIKTENHFGFVHEKTILSTRIRTLTGEIVTIPNANLMSTSIINYNAIQRELKMPLMITTSITLGYDVPWRTVYQALSDAAYATENILEDPAPYVLQTSLDDFYITYELRAYINLLEKRTLALSNLHENIQDKCNEVGIEIMSPHYSAIRDGNQNTIPENYLPSDYVSPSFRISPLGKLFKNIQNPSQDEG